MPIPIQQAFYSPEGKALESTKSPVSKERGFLAMDNAWFCRDEPDAVEPVPGFSEVAQIDDGGGNEGILRNIHFAYKSDGTRMTTVAGDFGTGSSGFVYAVETDGSTHLIKSGLTDGVVTDMAQLNDFVFFGNGTDSVFDSSIHPSSPTVADTGLARLDVSGATATTSTADVNSVRGTVKYFVAPFDNTAAQFARPDGGEGDQSDGWTNTSGSTNANLYVDIDESTRSDADYVTTTTLTTGGGSSGRYFELSDVTDPTTSVNHIVRYVYKSNSSSSDVDLTVSLVQDWNGTPTTHSSWTHTSIPDTWTLQEQTLATAEADAITDYTDLSLHFLFTNQSSGGVETLNPVADKNTSGTWSPGGTIWNEVDANDNNYQSNTSASTGDWINVKMQSTANRTSGTITSYMRAKCATNGNARLDLIQLSTTKDTSGSKSFTASESEKTMTTSASTITDYSKLRLRFYCLSDDQFDVDQLKIEVPAQDESAYLSWCELEVPAVAASQGSVSEGAISLAFGEVDAGDGKDIDLSNIPLGSTGAVRLYRTYANGTNPYYVTSLSGTIGGTTSYTDDLPDIHLGDPPYNHGDPPLATYKGCISYANRMWWFRKDTSYVDYSDLTEPESYWNITNEGGNWIEVFGNDGDVITALAAATDGIIVFKRNHVYKIRGTSPEDFFAQQLTLSDAEVRSVGTPHTQSMVSAPSGLYFYWNKDFWEFDGSTIRRISKGVHNDLDAITEANESYVRVGYWHAERMALFSVPLGGAENDYTYMYDITNRRIVGRIAEGFNGFSTIEDTSGNTEFWALATDTGSIYKFDDGTTFDISNIATTVTLPSFYGHDITQQKRFLYVDLYFEPTTSSGENVDVVAEIDGISGSTISVSLDTEDADNDRNKRRINLGYIGRELRITVSGDGGSTEPPTWKLYGWNFGFQKLPGISN